MKDLFKNVIQEALEAEMDDTFGYNKYNVSKGKGESIKVGICKYPLNNLR